MRSKQSLFGCQLIIEDAEAVIRLENHLQRVFMAAKTMIGQG